MTALWVVIGVLAAFLMFCVGYCVGVVDILRLVLGERTRVVKKPKYKEGDE